MPARIAGRVRDHYMELVGQFPLASIKGEAELREAQAIIDGILGKGRLTKGQMLYLDALSDLVRIYENFHHPMPSPSDAAILQHFMEAQSVTQKQLHEATGIAMSTISEVLSGKRSFTKGMIGALSTYFGVDKGVFAANF